jgi:hypothetical protein
VETVAFFAYAHGVWNRVDGADNPIFLMGTGIGACGSNTYETGASVRRGRSLNL